MEKQKKQKGKIEEKQEKKEKDSISCRDMQCPVHGLLKVRGRHFKGSVVRKLLRRIAIEFERTVYIRKYERYLKKKTRIHARLPDCMKEEINIGDYIEVGECRPLSKLIHFVVIRKLRSRLQFQDDQKSEVMKISDIKKIRGANAQEKK